jgi:tRNA guanosine-2'-O-methyltransferase
MGCGDDLIMCSVLVQNPVNLGGLCRTCEVFGVSELVVSDLAVRDLWPFRQVAASGHHWQRMQACSVNDLGDWLAVQRARGYQLVAMTVKGQVQPLPEYRFERKTVLVLGRELTGIPREIEQRCDVAIAIPQYGQVDSLNVQVAAAIGLYEYRRQYPAR